MKTILLLTDFSDNALNAICYAMNLFKNETCTFHIMNVHKAGSFTSDDLMSSPKGSIYESITKIPREKLNKLVGVLKNEFKNKSHSFKISIDFDVFTDAVNQVVKNENIDYIVLGSNGATGAKEILFGSNTLNVIRKVTCKTLIIPEGYIYKPIKELLLTLDTKDKLTDDAFTSVLEFKNTYLLNLHVLRINPRHDASEHSVSDISNLSLIDCDYYKIDNVPISYAVKSYIQTNTIDIVTLFSKKESILERFFNGSSTTEISETITLPLLIIHS